MTFDPDDPRLTAFALGELDEADRLAVEAMLASSPEASRFVGELRETAALLSDTLRAEPAPGLSIVQRIDLDARIAGRPRGGIRLRRALAAVAAGVALAAGGFGVGRFSAPGDAIGDRPAAGLAAESFALAAPEAEGPPTSTAGPAEVDSAIAADADMPTLDAFGDGPVGAAASVEARGTAPRSVARALPGAAPTGEAPVGFAPDDRATPEASAAREEAESALGLEATEDRPRRSEPRLGEAAQGLPAAPLADAERSGAQRPAAPGRSPAARQAGQSADLAAVPPPSGLPSPEGQETPTRRADQRPGGVIPPAPTRLGAAGMGGMGASVAQGRGLGPSEPGSAAEAIAPARKAARIEAGNVLEVIDLPGGDLSRRIVFPSPVRDVEIDPAGKQLLATTEDRSLSLFDVDSGLLLNAFQVAEGPVPAARFGPAGELILSNLAPGSDRGGVAPGADWLRPEVDPVAAIPIDPGAATLGELAAWLRADRPPGGAGTVVARLVNAPPYPYDRPEGGEAIGIDVRIASAPWDDRRWLVRIALLAGEAGRESPPIAAEGVAAEVEFNPARVAGYRPIGFEARPSPVLDPGSGRLAAGSSITVLFEVDPAGAGLAIGRAARRSRYQSPATPPAGAPASGESLTVMLSYREPGGGDRRSIERPGPVDATPLDASPDDVRLASAMAWLGHALERPRAERSEALAGVAELVRSCDEGYLPSYRAALLGLIEPAREPGRPD